MTAGVSRKNFRTAWLVRAEPRVDLGVAHAQQLERIDAESVGYPFQRLEREVALAPLDSAHVRSVDAQHIGKGLLAEFPSLTV